MKKVKITPETYQKMEDEFREEGLAFTITIPTQETIDKWQNATPIPQPVRHNVDMVADIWMFREDPCPTSLQTVSMLGVMPT